METSSAKNAEGREPESLENLLTTLSKHINSSDWLKQNTPEKFAAENPEVAQAFKDIAEKKKEAENQEDTEKK